MLLGWNSDGTWSNRYFLAIQTLSLYLSEIKNARNITREKKLANKHQIQTVHVTVRQILGFFMITCFYKTGNKVTHTHKAEHVMPSHWNKMQYQFLRAPNTQKQNIQLNTTNTLWQQKCQFFSNCETITIKRHFHHSLGHSVPYGYNLSHKSVLLTKSHNILQLLTILRINWC